MVFCLDEKRAEIKKGTQFRECLWLDGAYFSTDK
jgi:hypothetical protein